MIQRMAWRLGSLAGENFLSPLSGQGFRTCLVIRSSALSQFVNGGLGRSDASRSTEPPWLHEWSVLKYAPKRTMEGRWAFLQATHPKWNPYGQLLANSDRIVSLDSTNEEPASRRLPRLPWPLGQAGTGGATRVTVEVGVKLRQV